MLLHVLLAFLLTTVFCAVRPGRSKRLVRGVLRGGKESEKCEPVIAFLRRSSSRVSRVKCNTSDGENGHCLTARLPPTARRPPRRQHIVGSGNVRSFGRQVMAHTGRGFDLSKSDSEFPSLEASVAEVRRLREENARLRSL